MFTKVATYIIPTTPPFYLTNYSKVTRFVDEEEPPSSLPMGGKGLM